MTVSLLWHAVRTAWRATYPLEQGAGVLVAGAGVGLHRRPPKVATPPLDRFRRLFAWLAASLVTRHGSDTPAELIERIVSCHETADATARGHIGLELLGHFESQDRAAYGPALRVATALPLPEARSHLVGVLADYCMPEDTSEASPRPTPPELLPLVVDALSRLNDPRDRRIFSFVVSRFCRTSMQEELAWRIARRAAVALCRASPEALETDVPAFFRHDAEVRAAALPAGRS